MTASVTESRVTPHMVAPAAMSPYTPGWMHVASPTDGQPPQIPHSGNRSTTH